MIRFMLISLEGETPEILNKEQHRHAVIDQKGTITLNGSYSVLELKEIINHAETIIHGNPKH